MRHLAELIRQHLSLFPDGPRLPDASPGDQRLFDTQCHARLGHHCRVIAAVALLFTLVWWPLDLWVMRDLPGALHGNQQWRVVIVVISVLFLTLPQPAWLRRNVFWFMAAVGVGCGLIMGYAAGLMGGPDKPFFHLLYPILLFSMVLPLPLPRRVVGTALLGAGIFAGLLLDSPRHLHSPYFPIAVSMMPFLLLMSVGFGHLFFVLSREHFFQALQLQQATIALKEHNELLESRVAAQTHELRRLLAHVESAREDERARISRELHDELGQELSAMRYTLAFTRQRHQVDPGSISANLSELEGILNKTTSTARSLVADLRPHVLDHLGLGAAVEWLVRRTEQRTGICCQLDMNGSGPVDSERSIAAFRILQESLTNVARHASAQRVVVSLSIDSAFLELRVRDNGAGFSVAERTGAGMGLLGMRERVQSLAGEFKIESAIGAGTQILARLPLPPSP